MRTLRCIPLLVGLAVAVALPGQAVRAQNTNPDNTITVNLRDVSLYQALAELADQHGRVVQFAPDVPDVRISINVRDIPFENLMRIIIRTAAVQVTGLTKSRNGNVYLIHIPPLEQQPRLFVADQPVDPRLAQKRTLDLPHVPLRRALAALFEGSEVQYQVEKDVPDLPVDLKLADEMAFAGLLRVVKAARAQEPALEFTRERGVYTLGLTPLPPPLPPVNPATLRQHRVTVSVQDVPFRSVVEQIFAGSGLQYSIDPTIANTPIRLDLRNVPLDQALLALTQSAARVQPGLRWGQSGDVLVLQRVRVPVAPPAR